jgi:hypothetical protein
MPVDGIRVYILNESLPYMDLVIEAVDEPGPARVPLISVAYYGEHNGDLMRDPEMCFELAVKKVRS